MNSAGWSAGIAQVWSAGIRPAGRVAGPVRGNRESGRPRMVAPCLECAVGWPNSILKQTRESCLDLCFLGLGLHQGGLPKITVQRGLRPSFSMYPSRRRCPHWRTPRPRLPIPKSAKRHWRTASRFLRSRQFWRPQLLRLRFGPDSGLQWSRVVWSGLNAELEWPRKLRGCRNAPMDYFGDQFPAPPALEWSQRAPGYQYAPVRYFGDSFPARQWFNSNRFVSFGGHGASRSTRFGVEAAGDDL